MKKIILRLITLAFITLPLFSQTDITPPMIFAPFVSRIMVEVRNNLIRLTWRDSPDLSGPVYVYKSNQPFSGPSSMSSIQPVQVPYGTQSYIDELESTGIWYYFVAASDTDGNRYNMTIPLNNVISVSIQDSITELLMGDPYISKTGAGQPPQAASQARRGGLSGLTARVDGESVIISFNTAEAKTPVLYRNVKPIVRTNDLLSAVMIQSAAVSPFVDHPVPDIPYYYAVVYEENLAQGQAGIVPGQNSTVEAVRIAQGGPSETKPRSVPLPRIAVQGAVPQVTSSSAVPSASELSPQASRAVSGLGQRRQERKPLRLPEILAAERSVSGSGGDLVLKAIVENYFIKREWNMARIELKNYIETTRTRDQESRARFYLGQTMYFMGEPRDALLEFLLVRQPYEQAAAEWIQAAMSSYLSGGALGE